MNKTIDFNFPIFNNEDSSNSTIKLEEDLLLLSGLDSFPFDVSTNFDDILGTFDESCTSSVLDSINAFDLDGFPKENVVPNTESSSKMQRFLSVKYVNGKAVKVWKCLECGKQFDHHYTLSRHLPTHTDERKYECRTCGKAFRQMSTLSQHRAIHSADRPYICDICQKTFNRVSTLISHKKTHTGLKPHRCHICEKSFHQKGNLRNHIFTHTNERPYKCDICDRGFNQMSNLMCHKSKTHQMADKPRYCCRICYKSFPKRKDMRLHEQTEHGFPQSSMRTILQQQQQQQQQFQLQRQEIRLQSFSISPPTPPPVPNMKEIIDSKAPPNYTVLKCANGDLRVLQVVPNGDQQVMVPLTPEYFKQLAQAAFDPLGTMKPPIVPTQVEVKVPVIGSVAQTQDNNNVLVSIINPPIEEIKNEEDKDSETNNFLCSSTLKTSANFTEGTIRIDEESLDQAEPVKVVKNAQLEFLNSSGNVITEKEFKKNLEGDIPQAVDRSDSFIANYQDNELAEIKQSDIDAAFKMEDLAILNEDDLFTQLSLPWEF